MNQNDFLFKKRHRRRGWLTAVWAAAVLICSLVGCQADVDAGQVNIEQTVQETQQTTTTEEKTEQIIKDAKKSETETSVENKDNAAEAVIIAGKEYSTDETYIEIIAENDNFDISNVSYFADLRYLGISGSEKQERLIGTESISELKNLKTFEISGCTISDLSFLEGLDSLENLNLNNCSIDNETEANLSNLNALERVYIYKCGISYVGFLSNLSNLKELQLVDNNIYDISDLNNLPNLYHLSLSENHINDLKPLSKFPSLELIGLEYNDIDDISQLALLKSTISVSLNGNNIYDLSEIPNIENLVSIDLSENPISDISPLSECSSLSKLCISGNGITDLSPIGEINSLTSLEIKNTNCSDFSFVSNLANISHLVLSDNNIEDISFLSNIPVSYLILDNNNISDISPIYGINERIDVNPVISLYGNPIDIKDIEDLRQKITPRNTICIWFETPYFP